MIELEVVVGPALHAAIAIATPHLCSNSFTDELTPCLIEGKRCIGSTEDYVDLDLVLVVTSPGAGQAPYLEDGTGINVALVAEQLWSVVREALGADSVHTQRSV